jgi:hypothetical protein
MYRVVRDSAVSTATCYGLQGPGMEPRCGARLSAPVPTSPGAFPKGKKVKGTKFTGSFPGLERPGRGTDHPLPSRAEVEEREELYFYATSGSSWLVVGLNEPLFYLYWVYKNRTSQRCITVCFILTREK